MMHPTALTPKAQDYEQAKASCALYTAEADAACDRIFAGHGYAPYGHYTGRNTLLWKRPNHCRQCGSELVLAVAAHYPDGRLAHLSCAAEDRNHPFNP